MRATAPFVASALISLSLATSPAHDARDVLVARDTLKPTSVCGSGAVDCGNGFCCKSGNSCISYQGIPVCQVPGVGTLSDAYPYDSSALTTAQAALSSYLASYTTSSAAAYSAATSSAAPYSTPIYGYGNSSSAYYPTGTSAPTPTYNATASSTGAAETPTFTGAAGSVEVGLGLLMGVLGVGFVL